MTTALVLQCQDDAPPGLLGPWARERGIALDVRRVDRGEPLPDPYRYDLAFALGSDASLAGPPPSWARPVIDWLRDAEAAGVPVLGICFGAQALAVAHGGRVTRLPQPEIGLVDIDSADADRVPGGPWIAWHEDVVSLPPLAYELARNEVGPQAFCVGHALAVQFHPEATAAILADWADADDGRALADVGIERGALEQRARQVEAQASSAAFRLFDRFARATIPLANAS
ncbi:type 1 glutamine amidotransferase [Patulibacter defluvii]|uniref:type 1 glutamine amidotransferase n=1 Tax=Patulibacter defluvii TaxID=3095358 RepID=UPI002A75FEB3|nr:type 1 glutamine amidotransferase [Patulibacter sp. DM4]